tara:strand:- start:268 stop:522 length:255 start_codon:yes stop_codon:yes gene_type:complete
MFYSKLVLVTLLSLSLSKSKNLERRLNLLAQEAITELNKVCESSLWESLGFVYFDQLDSKDKIAKANFYYGQLQIINELKLFSN